MDDKLFVIGNVKRVDSRTLLKESDVVALDAILTGGTRIMIGFAVMQPTAIPINPPQGPCIDEAAPCRGHAASRPQGDADAFWEGGGAENQEVPKCHLKRFTPRPCSAAM
jgi:hypothetical protein